MQFQGTPIGPRHFITASHIGGAVGEIFQFRGANYTTISTTKDPESDLQIWEISGTFPAFAQLYDGPSETGREVVLFGRGYTRGDEVTVGGALKGWKWGSADLRMRWGRNTVSSLVDDEGQPVTLTPLLLKATFDATGGANEAHLAGGDSGGGAFIQQSGVWRLAGVNYTVDGGFNTTNTGPGFGAALFDTGGLYTGAEGNWHQVLDTPIDSPSALYATRIKVRLAWIQSVLAQPATTVLVGASQASGPFAPSAGVAIDAATKTIRVPISETQYFQLQSAASLHITSSHLEGSTLVLQYE
jgi:hypothetical protein